MNNLIPNFPTFPNLQQPSPSPAAAPGESEGNFGSALKTAINQVEEIHTSAEQQVTELLKGDRSDVHNVMIAVEKADVAFQMMMQVRNKIVSAYQEISRMQF
jgi:flagellar hook-basal body complex protein FliE